MLSKNIQREQKGQRRKYKLLGVALAVAELSWWVFSKLRCYGKEGVWNVMKFKFLQIMAWSWLVAWSCSWVAKNTVNTPFPLCAWSLLLLFLFIRVGSGLSFAEGISYHSTAVHSWNCKADKQYKSIKRWNKGCWAACFTGTCGSLCAGVYPFKHYCSAVGKAPGNIGVFYNNPVGDQPSLGGGSQCHAVNTSHF